MFWVEVLNHALEWRDADGLAGEPAGRAARVLPLAVLGALRDDVALLRHVFAASYLGRPLCTAQARHLEQWLAAVTLRPARPLHQLAKTNSASRTAELPVLRAARARGAHPEPFETLLSTALVRLVGELDEPDVMTVVHRCHGLVRRPRVPLVTGWSPELDEAFARKARCLAFVRDNAMQQCERLVVSERGSRYCGKACSNAAFVARKSRNDPKYFAEKQRRYRRRKESRPREQAARVESGAFVYID